MSGCSVGNENPPDVSLTENPEYQSGFDIERVRKSIVVKGQPFEIPVALKDLKDGVDLGGGYKAYTFGR